jgi:hypothetical protein
MCPCLRATGGCRLLRRCVSDEVALFAAAVEGVLEVQPVTRLVRHGLALVEAAGIAVGRPRHGFPVDDDAVEIRLRRLVNDEWASWFEA